MNGTDELTSTKDWFVYLVENKHQQLYAGITTNPTRRLRQHNGELTGGAKALKGKGPCYFRCIFKVTGKSEALKLEHWIKRQPKKTKCKLIEGEMPPTFVTERVAVN